MTLRTTGQIIGALGVYATTAVCTLYVTKSTAQRTKEGGSQQAVNWLFATPDWSPPVRYPAPVQSEA